MPIVTLRNREGAQIYQVNLNNVPRGWTVERMRGLAVRRAVAAGVSLENADLAGVDMSGLIFEAGKLNLSGADLRKAIFIRATAPRAKFNNALLDDALLTYASFPDSEFNGASFRLTNASSVNFTNSDCRNALFDQAHVTYANFSLADLRGARFPHARYEHAVLEGAKMTREDIQALALQGARINVAVLHVVEPQIDDVPKPEAVDAPNVSALAAADVAAAAMRMAPRSPRMSTEEERTVISDAAPPAAPLNVTAAAKIAETPIGGAIFGSRAALEAARDDYRDMVGLTSANDRQGEMLPPDSPVEAAPTLVADGAARDTLGRLYLPDEAVALFNRAPDWPPMMTWPPKALTIRMNEIANDAGVASVLRRVAKGEPVSDSEWTSARDAFGQDETLKQIAKAIESNIAAAKTMAAFLHRADQPTVDMMRRPGFAFLFAGDFSRIDGALNPRTLRDAPDPATVRKDSPEAVEAARQSFFQTAVASVTPGAITMTDGGVVTSRSDGSLRTPEVTPQAARMFVEEAKARGWTQIVVRGGPEFVRAVQQAAANDPAAPPVVTSPKMSMGSRLKQMTVDRLGASPIGRTMDELRGAPVSQYVRLRPPIVRPLTPAPAQTPPHTPSPVAPPPTETLRTTAAPGAEGQEVARAEPSNADVAAASRPDDGEVARRAAAEQEARRAIAKWRDEERAISQAESDQANKALDDADRNFSPTPFNS